MVTTVVTVGPECSIENVAETLLENRVSAVPVVSNGGDVVGMCTINLQAETSAHDFERLARIPWPIASLGSFPPSRQGT
jgi:CBS domain-containing protein